MSERGTALDEASFLALVGRVANDAERLVRAEIAVHVATVKVRVAGAKVAAVFFGVALLLVIAAFVVLVGGLAAWLARWIGPLGGAAAAALIALAVAGLLGRLGAKRLSPPAASELSAK